MDPKTILTIRIIFAIIGMLVGLSIFFSFGFAYNNWHCAGWGMASGVFAAITLWVHLQWKRDELRRFSFALRPLQFFGVLIQVVSLAAFVVYLVIAIKQRQDVTPYGNGFYVTAVWCVMTWKWSFLLFWYCRKYRNILKDTLQTSPDTAYQKI